MECVCEEIRERGNLDDLYITWACVAAPMFSTDTKLLQEAKDTFIYLTKRV